MWRGAKYDLAPLFLSLSKRDKIASIDSKTYRSFT